MAKMGRPLSDNPKSVKLTIRIENEIDKKLSDYSKKNNITKTDVIRKGIDMVLKEEE